MAHFCYDARSSPKAVNVWAVPNNARQRRFIRWMHPVNAVSHGIARSNRKQARAGLHFWHVLDGLSVRGGLFEGLWKESWVILGVSFTWKEMVI